MMKPSSSVANCSPTFRHIAFRPLPSASGRHPHFSPVRHSTLRLTHLGVSDQLHCPSLVGSETSDLTNDGLDDLCALSLGALPSGWALREDSSLSLVSSVDTPNETCEERSEKGSAPSTHKDNTLTL